jgi:hypothetical protein
MKLREAELVPVTSLETRKAKRGTHEASVKSEVASISKNKVPNKGGTGTGTGTGTAKKIGHWGVLRISKRVNLVLFYFILFLVLVFLHPKNPIGDRP